MRAQGGDVLQSEHALASVRWSCDTLNVQPMTPAPTPPDEPARLRRLRELMLLDTPAEPVFDSIVQLASQLCDMPVALLSLVDEERQWFKAKVGLPGVEQTPREVAFYTVAGAKVPLFTSMGNHGLLRSDTNHPQFVNWPQTKAVSTSLGKYVRETYCCLLGTASLNLPSMWYAFDAGPVRMYILHAAWADTQGGINNDPYEVDAAYHWQTTSPEYQWLKNDLEAHPARGLSADLDGSDNDRLGL